MKVKLKISYTKDTLKYSIVSEGKVIISSETILSPKQSKKLEKEYWRIKSIEMEHTKKSQFKKDMNSLIQEIKKNPEFILLS